MNDRSHIEALWVEPGTAADAAAAANLHRGANNKISADGVREIWKLAPIEGRLPVLVRPEKGFSPEVAVAIRKIMATDNREQAA